jgi:hypothetical protein
VHSAGLLIFDIMRTFMIRIVNLLLALSFSLVLTVFGFSDGMISPGQISAPVECADTSGQSEPSEADCTGDEVFANDSKVKPGLFPELLGILTEQPGTIISCDKSSIWQPPRLS